MPLLRPGVAGYILTVVAWSRAWAGANMRRREFINLVAGSAVAWPLTARAQQAMPVVGFLGSRSPDASLIAAFRGGVGETGFIEGRNVSIEFRWAEGDYDRLRALSADLVARQVAVIAVSGVAGALALKATTSKIPIIFSTGADPVQSGLVVNLNRPDGNVTGVAILSNTLVPKQLELLREVVPTATLVACLVNPKNPIAETETRTLESAASSRSQRIIVLYASDESEIDDASETLVRQHAGSLLVQGDPFLNSQRDKIIALAASYAVPAVYGWSEFPAAGGLMSYGTSLNDAYRQLGIYAGKILKGAKPADLPVQQSVKVQLVINLRTAKALGITFPLSLLGRADEVIE
jgi:putative tryptophan/tyrosine transport system substrate-binding protein